MGRKILALMCAGLYGLYANPALTAGFVCGKAATRVEKAICASSELSTLDEHLSRHYGGAKYALPEGEACLKSDQLHWLKSVRNVCKDNACLKMAYLNRLSELNGLQPGMNFIQYIDLPDVPSLVWIIPPLDQDAAPGKSGAALELIGKPGWAEDGSDAYVMKTKPGDTFFINIPGLRAMKTDRFPEFAKEKNATFMLRGYAVKVDNRNIYFDPGQCVFFYRM
jgi:uncharacterized protein YecT (DUF1311 family)